MAGRALILQGGWEGHDPLAFAEHYAARLREAGLAVEIASSLDALLDREALRGLSLIVPIWSMGTISPEPLQNLLDAVADGVGLAGFHGGMGDAFRDAPEFQWMVGGQFVAHPDGIKEYEVAIVDRESPITRGLGDFRVTSEQYYMHVDPSNHVLATTTFHPAAAPWAEGVVMPVAWTRRWGAGAVFYSSIGHSVRELDVPEVGELQQRGMLWAAAARSERGR
jgi:type 1 glutamine amidotransferase